MFPKRFIAYDHFVGAVAGYAFYGCTGASRDFGLGRRVELRRVCVCLFGTGIRRSSRHGDGDRRIAYSGCASLTEIKVAADNANYASYDGCLYDAALKVLYTVPSAKTSVEFRIL